MNTPQSLQVPPSPPVDAIDDHETGVGLSDAQLSQSRRQMLDLVNRLQSTGVQVDIDLPQIAVIGSQSAGKSSLIESISGITLPRAAGTCTRCPTECRLSRSDTPWHCKVSLRFIKDRNGQPLGQARNEDFGTVIYDKAEVEERIRRAQRAILNPSSPRSQFLDGDEEDPENSELTFSSNVVSLAISGPGVADLSFCDLPGLIASVSSNRGSSNDIALVEGLVTSYIKKPSCIILLTVACETDFENQGAHRLAKIHDPEGKRTIGVLTKPDRIPTGEEQSWIRFIRNEREPLDNNWYCVKQPSSNDIKQNITWNEARKREDDFFTLTAPWSELDTMYHKYLRTRNLVERLSSVLSDLISKRLPEIQEELERGIIATRQAIERLPPPPSTDPVNDIANLLHVFTSDLRRHVDGIPNKKGLLQSMRPAQQKFRKAIRDTAPEFMPFHRENAGTRFLPRPQFLDNEEEFEVSASQDAEDSYPEEALSEGEEITTSAITTAGGRAKGVKVGRNSIYVDEVYEIAHQARTRELPGNYPFVVQQTFIKDIIAMWSAPALVYLEAVQAILSGYVKKLVTEHFENFGQGTLEQRIKTIIYNHLKECFTRAENRIKWFIELEALPFTLNQHYLSDYREKFLAYYKAAREDDIRNFVTKQVKAYKNTASTLSNSRASDDEYECPKGIPKVLLGLTEMGITGILPDDIYKILPADEMAPAISIMADVRAYFQVAYKRFADNIPLAVDYELVQGIERDVLKILYMRLGINGPDGQRIAKELAQESAQVADKRQDLSKKLERLQIASMELLELS
ncbi:hypothetical protein EST38_g2143 [Candolleomyces aberdarensis]|uniref:Uncharacterized protein n=1 Tax=Candolleomyces aberdarensis TaxID=2316362 RepID=A0A4Q2DU07_9AGAR|nr:hypothetical protein EST38_g2143 [Candolleomyces aberdarensis]